MDARFGTFASNSVRYEKTKSIHGDGLPARLLLRLFGPAGGAVRLPIVRIDTVGVYGTPRTVQFPGCVRAAQEVNAAFKVGGTLRTIFAEEGEFVRRGAPLAALDARDYRLQAEAAEAEYKRVRPKRSA